MNLGLKTIAFISLQFCGSDVQPAGLGSYKAKIKVMAEMHAYLETLRKNLLQSLFTL